MTQSFPSEAIKRWCAFSLKYATWFACIPKFTIFLKHRDEGTSIPVNFTLISELFDASIEELLVKQEDLLESHYGYSFRDGDELSASLDGVLEYTLISTRSMYDLSMSVGIRFNMARRESQSYGVGIRRIFDRISEGWSGQENRSI
jgi:hypothetical protein